MIGTIIRGSSDDELAHCWTNASVFFGLVTNAMIGTLARCVMVSVLKNWVWVNNGRSQ
jgi:hypothetical protein